MKQNSNYELDLLKKLLLKEELDKLEILERKIKDLELEASNADVLARKVLPLFNDILLRSIQEKDSRTINIFSKYISKIIAKNIQYNSNELRESLQSIISTTISKEIESNKDKMIDSLYPIMGGMISKYVTQSIKELMENINKKIENGLSFENYKRKLKAKTTGVSETELLLNESNSANISSIFIIQKDSGLLIAESHLINSELDDTHMIASMASAIKDFINDWIQNNDSNSEIQILSYGNATLYIESAGSAYLIAFLDSEPSYERRSNINSFFATLVTQHSTLFQSFDGNDNDARIKELSREIHNYISNQTIPEPKKKSNLSKYILWILSTVLISYMIYSAYLWSKIYLLEQKIQKETSQIVRIQKDDQYIYIYGQVDSLDQMNKIYKIIHQEHNRSIKNKLTLSAQSVSRLIVKNNKYTKYIYNKINRSLEQYALSAKIDFKKLQDAMIITDDKINYLEKRQTLNTKSISNISDKIIRIENDIPNSIRELEAHIYDLESKINTYNQKLIQKINSLDIAKPQTKHTLSIKNKIGKELEIEFSNNEFYNKNSQSLDFGPLELFEDGSTTYNPAYIKIFKSNFEKYIKVLNKYKDYIAHIYIVGHTNSKGSSKVNDNISNKRASAVRNYIYKQGDIKRYKIYNTIISYGESNKKLIYKNGVEDDKASKRITVTFKTKSDKIIRNVNKDIK